MAQGPGTAIDCTHPEVKDLPMCASAPPQAAPGAADPKKSERIGPSVGVAAHLWAFNRGAYSYTNQVDTSDKGKAAYLMRSTAGGAMLFFEKRDVQHFAIRAEMGIWFPKVERIRSEDGPSVACYECKWDVVLALMVTLKVHFQVGKWVAIYPLLGVGGGFIFSLYHGTSMVSRIGYSFGTGVGVEAFPTAHVAPFFELRYQIVGGRHHEETTLRDAVEWLHYHAVMLALGVRFH